MNLTTHTSGGVVVVNVFGTLDINSHLALKKKIRECVDEGTRKILLDMSGIQSIDSTGIGTLVALLNTARSHNGDVRLAGSFDPCVEEIFRLCGLHRVFTVYEDIDSGITGFTA